MWDPGVDSADVSARDYGVHNRDYSAPDVTIHYYYSIAKSSWWSGIVAVRVREDRP